METSPSARRLTSRFIAGLELEQGLEVCRKLNGQGIYVALDHLGENVTTLEEAAYARDAALEALNAIGEQGLRATVSVKLSHFGMDISEKACLENTAVLAERAREIGTRVEVDMESSPYVVPTLRVIEVLHERFQSMRAVIQAYLYRSEEDILRLSERGIPVRLCKGAYNEPPEVAYPKKRQVDESFKKLTRILMEQGTDPAIATHDEAMILSAIESARACGLEPQGFEFQMLYGIRRDLQNRLVADGYRMRVYVPYGEAWYPYFMRRLAERPANAIFLLRNLLR
ncbi:MAG: proline dehydrogenase family protein [Bryobacteraceae bacterium]